MLRRLPGGMRPDYLVQRRDMEERKIADAAEYDKKMKLIGINTDWAEKKPKISYTKC